jgi:hypothetical protein
MPTRSDAPPAGADAAGPRPDLRGHRLGTTALLMRPHEQMLAKRFHGLIAGFLAGLAVGVVMVVAGVPAPIVVLVAAVVNYVVGMWVPGVLLSPADRRLLGVANRLAAHVGLAWRRAYGRAPIFRSEEQSLLWIAAQPATTTNPEALEIETSVLLSLGRHAEARERAVRIPDEAPWWRFVRTYALAAIEYDGGGRGDLADTRAAAEAVHGERRGTAIASLALEEASRAMIRGDDWDPPIARAAAAVKQQVLLGIVEVLFRARRILPWLILSEVALGAVLYLLRDRVL